MIFSQQPVECCLRRNAGQQRKPGFLSLLPLLAAVILIPLLFAGAYAPGALLNINNLSDLANTTTARTNLGLGTAATKASSAAGATVASVTGSFTATHVAVFADTSGTIQDGGAAPTGTMASQNANAVAVTGGTIDGTAIGATTPSTIKVTTADISGILTTHSGTIHNVRVVVASGAVAMATTDEYVVVNKTAGGATVVNAISSPTSGTLHCIKDGKGDANTNNITFTPNAGNVDGAATFVMNQNFQGACFLYNGTQWNIL